MPPAQPWVTASAGLAVTFGWLFTLGVGAFEHDWTAATITTPVMLLFGSYAFGALSIRRQRLHELPEHGDREEDDDRWSHLP